MHTANNGISLRFEREMLISQLRTRLSYCYSLLFKKNDTLSHVHTVQYDQTPECLSTAMTLGTSRAICSGRVDAGQRNMTTPNRRFQYLSEILIIRNIANVTM